MVNKDNSLHWELLSDLADPGEHVRLLLEVNLLALNIQMRRISLDPHLSDEFSSYLRDRNEVNRDPFKQMINRHALSLLHVIEETLVLVRRVPIQIGLPLCESFQ
jgi:hypothetical protein